MRLQSLYVPKSRAIMLAVALAILLAGTAKAVPALPAQQQQPSKAKPEPKKEKKVWTDENIGELGGKSRVSRSEEHTSELQSLAYLVCRLLLEKKKYDEVNDR